MNNILIQSSSRYPIRRKKIKETVTKTLEAMQISGAVEVEINVVGDRKMRTLKRDHLGIDETTDVLSFPIHEKIVGEKPTFVSDPDGFIRIGTIFVSYPQAQRQANIHKLLIDDEIDQLVEHGILHLVGVHHD